MGLIGCFNDRFTLVACFKGVLRVFNAFKGVLPLFLLKGVKMGFIFKEVGGECITRDIIPEETEVEKDVDGETEEIMEVEVNEW